LTNKKHRSFAVRAKCPADGADGFRRKHSMSNWNKCNNYDTQDESVKMVNIFAVKPIKTTAPKDANLSVQFGW